MNRRETQIKLPGDDKASWISGLGTWLMVIAVGAAAIGVAMEIRKMMRENPAPGPSKVQRSFDPTMVMYLPEGEHLDKLAFQETSERISTSSSANAKAMLEHARSLRLSLARIADLTDTNNPGYSLNQIREIALDALE